MIHHSRPEMHRSKIHWLKVKWRWLRPHLQLSAESYVGLIFWTALVEFVRNVYWFQLQSGGIAPEIGFLAYLVIPAVVLGQPFLRELLDYHPWTRSLLLLCGLVGVWGQSERTPLKRLSFSGNSVAIMGVYVLEGVWTGTAARRRRTGFGMIGGILLLQVGLPVPEKFLLLEFILLTEYCEGQVHRASCSSCLCLMLK